MDSVLQRAGDGAGSSEPSAGDFTRSVLDLILDRIAGQNGAKVFSPQHARLTFRTERPWDEFGNKYSIQASFAYRVLANGVRELNYILSTDNLCTQLCDRRLQREYDDPMVLFTADLSGY